MTAALVLLAAAAVSVAGQFLLARMELDEDFRAMEAENARFPRHGTQKDRVFHGMEEGFGKSSTPWKEDPSR